MAVALLTDVHRALCYGESELGEVAILSNEAANTYTVVNAKSGAVVLAAGQTLATVKARVAVFHPGVTKINS
jgi:hypothetical protein